MRFSNKDELIISPRKQHANNKTVKIKPLNVYDAIREKLDAHNTMNV